MMPTQAAPAPVGLGGRLRASVAAAVTWTLGLPPVTERFARRTPASLRIVAYHRVPDRAAFDAQVREIARRYRIVTEDQVRAAAAGGAPLPDRAVWLSFDDGDPSVVRNGLPVLQAHGVSGTVYVCPGLIDAGAAPWWQVVETAGAQGHGHDLDGRHLVGRPLLLALKHVADPDRRAIVDELAATAQGHLPDPAALTRADLDAWVDAGCFVGNHTWDHPCLNHCDPDEQRRQIETAHRWLLDYQPDRTPTFAYPNGDQTPEAEAVLAGLGYDTALLFDHQLTDLGGHPLRRSRLKLDTDADLARTRAVLSGGHSTVMRRLGG